MDSLYYAYVQSPLCDYLVSKLPMWLAPNIITLCSFAFNVIPHFIIIGLYGNDMEGYCPNWVAFMLGVSYFMYTTLDNMDGKQARRTGAGSPLGMLFDHGLDATTAIVVMYPLGRIHQLGTGLDLLGFIMMSTVSFYYLTIEEYYLGKLHLPMYSGPDDTSLFISGICFFTAYVGSDYWMTEADPLGFGEERLVKFAIRSIVMFEICMVISSVYNNLSAGKHTETFKKRYQPLSFVMHLSYMAVLSGVYIAYYLAGSTMLDDYPKLTTMCYGAQYLQAALRTMIASVCKENYNPYRRTVLLPWLLMGINAVSLLSSGQTVFDDFWLMVFTCTIGWAAVAHYVYYILQDLTRILDVNIFTIKKKRAAKAATEAKREGKSESAEKILNSKKNITPKKKSSKTE